MEVFSKYSSVCWLVCDPETRHYIKRASVFRREKTVANDVSIRSARCSLQHASNQLLNENFSHDVRNSLEEKITSLRKKYSKDLSSTASILDSIKLFDFF